MPDARISELPAATTPLAEGDLAPFVQSPGGTLSTRRASVAQLRASILAGRAAHVQDYGARGDGVTNDAPAIQAAINDLGTRGGGVLQLGAGRYRIASAITVSGVAVTLQGMGFTEGPSPANGTWLVIANGSFVPITFSGLAARGGGLADLAFAQTHSNPFNTSWTPTSHPYAVQILNCEGGVSLDNVFFANVDRGVLCRNSGRLDIRRLRGQVFTAGVEIDECLDVPRLHNIHFWPFWSSNVDVLRWQQLNGDAIICRRSDGVFIDQAFALAYNSMFRFASSAAGVTTKFAITSAYADFCRHGLLIEGNGVDGRIGSLTTQGELVQAPGATGPFPPVAGATGILVTGTGARIQAGTLRIDDAEDNAIRLAGNDNRIDIGALRCVVYNFRNNGSAAISLGASGANPANRVTLASPAVLELGNAGALGNTGTNGILTVALHAQSAGALSAQPADAVLTGGNARGVAAVDWQQTRSAAAQVASAANAVVGGGRDNIADGVNSWIPGGAAASTRAGIGRAAWAAGNFAQPGDAQAGEHVLRARTIDATALRLTSNGAVAAAANSLALPSGGVSYALRILVIARQVTGGTVGVIGDSAMWETTALLRRNGNTASTVLLGGGGVDLVPVVSQNPGSVGWRLTVGVDIANGALLLEAKGELNKTINWVARVLSVETTGN